MSAPSPLLSALTASQDGLPVDAWASISHYLFFEDVLNLTAVNKFLRHDVPSQIKLIMVRTAKGLNVSSACLERFKSATDIYIYGLMEMYDPNGVCKHFVEPVSKLSIPFISQFLKSLETCSVGGRGCDIGEEEERVSTKFGIIVKPVSYSFEFQFDRKGSNVPFGAMTAAYCHALASEKISHDVQIEGFIPPQRGLVHRKSSCQFRGPAKLDIHRGDIGCQVCDLICHSLHPKKVLALEESDVCLDLGNRLSVIKAREPSLVTKEWCHDHLLAALTRPILERANFPETGYQFTGYAKVFNDQQTEDMAWLIEHGADPKDSRIREILLEKPRVEGYVHPRPLTPICLNSLMELRELGLKLNESEFEIIDFTGDPYTRPDDSYNWHDEFLSEELLGFE